MGAGDRVEPYYAPAGSVRDIAAEFGIILSSVPVVMVRGLETYNYDDLPIAAQQVFAKRYPDPELDIERRTELTDWQKVTRRGDILGALKMAVGKMRNENTDVQVDDAPLRDDVIEPDEVWQRIEERNAKLSEPLRKILGHVELGEKLKLNMGAGDQRYKGYIGIDIQQTPACDLVHDLEEPLPLPDGCASHIFCSHTLEHLHMWKVPLVLKDWFRLLADGGLLWGYVPDCEAAAQLFLDSNARVGTPEDDGTAQWAHQKATEMMLGASSYDFRRGDEQTHHCAFTHKTLRDVLNAGGFQVVQIDREHPVAWDYRLAFYAVKGMYPEHELPEPVIGHQEVAK